MLISRIAFLVSLAWGGWIAAQVNPDYTMTVGQAQGPSGGTANVSVFLEFTGPDVAGYSWSICNDPLLVEPTLVVPGADLAAVNGGAGPDFYANQIVPGGCTSAVVLSLFTPLTWAPGPVREIDVISYDLLGANGANANLDLCGTIGSPQIVVTVVSQGMSVPPVTISGSISIDDAVPQFEMSLPMQTETYEVGTGVGSLTTEVSLEELPSGVFPSDVFGFSVALTHSADRLIAANAGPATALGSLNGGMGPDFFSVNLLPSNVTADCVFSNTSPTELLTFPTATPILSVDYDTNATALAAFTTPVQTTISFAASAGNPPVSNSVRYVFGGATATPSFVSGMITLLPTGKLFVRGDCSNDDFVGFGDVFATLGAVFGTNPLPSCESRCDTNDDGMINIADASYLLDFIFLGGTAPTLPFPSCGGDPTADSLVCNDPCP